MNLRRRIRLCEAVSRRGFAWLAGSRHYTSMHFTSQTSRRRSCLHAEPRLPELCPHAVKARIAPSSAAVRRITSFLQASTEACSTSSIGMGTNARLSLCKRISRISDLGFDAVFFGALRVSPMGENAHAPATRRDGCGTLESGLP